MPTPVGYASVLHSFSGLSLPLGAAVTYGVDITVFAGDPISLAQDLHDFWTTRFMPFMPTSSSIDSTLVKFGPDATGPSAEYTDVNGGGSAGVPASPNVAYLIHKNTSLGGRAGRGRLYLPGVTEANVDGAGVVLPAGRTAIQTAATAFLGDLTSNNTDMVLLHGPGAPISSPTNVSSLSVDSRVATQRRRLRH